MVENWGRLIAFAAGVNIVFNLFYLGLGWTTVHVEAALLLNAGVFAGGLLAGWGLRAGD